MKCVLMKFFNGVDILYLYTQTNSLFSRNVGPQPSCFESEHSGTKGICRFAVISAPSILASPERPRLRLPRSSERHLSIRSTRGLNYQNPRADPQRTIPSFHFPHSRGQTSSPPRDTTLKHFCVSLSIIINPIFPHRLLYTSHDFTVMDNQLSLNMSQFSINQS